MRRRRPPPPAVELYSRTREQWASLGIGVTGFVGPPDDPVSAAHALIEASALTADELAVLDKVAAGSPDDRLPATFAQAALMAQRWRGPVEGLKLTALSHWGAT